MMTMDGPPTNGKDAAASSALLHHSTQGERHHDDDKDNVTDIEALPKAAETAAASNIEETTSTSSPSTLSGARRRRRKSDARKDKENDDNVTAATRTTPSKSRSSSSSSNWGSWRDSPSKSSSRRSKGISPKAFHGVVAAAARTAAATTSSSSQAPPYPPIAEARHGSSSKDTTSRSTPSKHQQQGVVVSTKKSGQNKVLELHATAQSNLVKQGKKQVLEEQKVKRSAFKQVTSLQTWPLQDRALRHYQQLMDQHLHREPSDTRTKTIDEEETDQKDKNEKTNQSPAAGAGLSTPTPTADTTGAAAATTFSASSQSSSSSSSSSSAFSADNEPKRLLRDLRWSPTKSRLKFQLQQDFLREQALEKGISLSSSSDADNNNLFGPALWCMEPRVFSIEKSATGKRKYVVGHAGRFLDAYWRKSNRSHRHYYELILQDTPIRLYLDLEFHKASNPDISPAMVETFLEQLLHSLAQQLQQSFPDQFGGEEHFELNRSHVVDLDSSTDKKFSRHWIVHLPGGYLFANTTALGRFMHAWVGDMLTAAAAQQQQQQGDDDSAYSVLFEHLFVNAPPSKAAAAAATAAAPSGTYNNKTCLIDLGVYTRNRLFRLMGSTKFGKPPSAALRIADANEFPFPDGFGNESFYLPAMSSEQQQQQLASQESQDSVEAVVEKFVTAVDWTTHAEALAQTLVVPLNSSKIDYPILPFDADQESSALSSSNNITSTRPKSSIVSSSSSSSLSFGRSPFPMIDDFVLHTLATRGGIQGSIRAWSVECDAEGNVPAYVTYQMSRNRWCENVQRAHKSNNIVWRVDLVLMRAVQTCHDPECRAMQFRGTPIPLPDAVQEQVHEQLRLLSCNGASSSTDNNNNDKKNDCDDDFADFDDESFERALAAMNLDEIESRFTSDNNNTAGDAAAAPQEQTSNKEPAKKSTDDEDDFDDFSDDDALVQAMLANPELFP